ncbi:sigma-70 family RNA polymerase sigma factor [Opitutales bacterium ASA1]|uniref:sigma-70 family RNA polymerase sigma factor n=1 Tax=Congregicoccus parvus TaxID=3081749 RepID=UPI002B2D1F1E|nr:sigma-70 family RNA polymerase sigma factor [Opitutales bacterium ASA1]
MDASLIKEKDDAELVRLVATGDRAAFSEFFERHASTLLAVAVRVLRERALAEDVVQETFLHIWRKASVYRADHGSAVGWAVVMTRNRAIDRLRSRFRGDALLVRVQAEWIDEDRVEAVVGDSDRAEHVDGALAELPRDQRRVIEMAFFAGLTQNEIARAIDEPLGTVKARIRRGLLKLRERLQRLR